MRESLRLDLPFGTTFYVYAEVHNNKLYFWQFFDTGAGVSLLPHCAPAKLTINDQRKLFQCFNDELASTKLATGLLRMLDTKPVICTGSLATSFSYGSTIELSTVYSIQDLSHCAVRYVYKLLFIIRAVHEFSDSYKLQAKI